jgi:hypothetical protein
MRSANPVQRRHGDCIPRCTTPLSSLTGCIAWCLCCIAGSPGLLADDALLTSSTSSTTTSAFQVGPPPGGACYKAEKAECPPFVEWKCSSASAEPYVAHYYFKRMTPDGTAGLWCPYWAYEPCNTEEKEWIRQDDKIETTGVASDQQRQALYSLDPAGETSKICYVKLSCNGPPQESAVDDPRYCAHCVWASLDGDPPQSHTAHLYFEDAERKCAKKNYCLPGEVSNFSRPSEHWEPVTLNWTKIALDDWCIQQYSGPQVGGGQSQ